MVTKFVWNTFFRWSPFERNVNYLATLVKDSGGSKKKRGRKEISWRLWSLYSKTWVLTPIAFFALWNNFFCDSIHWLVSFLILSISRRLLDIHGEWFDNTRHIYSPYGGVLIMRPRARESIPKSFLFTKLTVHTARLENWLSPFFCLYSCAYPFSLSPSIFSHPPLPSFFFFFFFFRNSWYPRFRNVARWRGLSGKIGNAPSHSSRIEEAFW